MTTLAQIISKSAIFSFAFLMIATAIGQVATAQDLSRTQRSELARIKKAIDNAEKSFIASKRPDSAKSINIAMKRMKTLLEGLDSTNHNEVKKQFNRIKKAHQMLTEKGEKLDKMILLKVGKQAEPKPEPTDGTSFVKQVAPILQAKCGRCHVARAQGGFSLANYQALMRGPTAGKVIFENKPDDSRLIEVIEEGDMPRGGLTVSAAELKTLKDWIKEGAKFDGEDATQNLARLAGGNAPTPRAERLRPKMADANSKISFSSEIASVINDKCSGCHLNTQRVRGGLNLSNFGRLLRGGDSGNIIKPGDGKNSLLVQRLKGEGGGQRMPAGSPPLTKEMIAKITAWIDEGAPFDGGNVQAPVGRLAALAKAKAASHEELSTEREAMAKRNWKMVMSNSEFTKVETENFLLLGELDEDTLKQYGKVAEDHAKKIAPLLKMPKTGPFIKGRMTIFMFKRRYDYSEFGKMIERRELPRSFKGHWGYSTIDGYAAILVSSSDTDETLSPTIAQQVAAVAMASAGDDVPKWFADGVGFWASAKIHNRSETVKEWRADSVKYAEAMEKTDDFIKGVLPDDQAALVSFYFVDVLNKSASRFGKLMAALKKGDNFDAAFVKAWGKKPDEMLRQSSNAGQRGGGKNRTPRRKK